MTEGLFASESAPYANFPSPGTHYEGVVTRTGSIQSRKYVPPKQRAAGVQGELETWPDNRPKMTAIITVQTDLHDPTIEGDDGRRSIFVDGKSKTDAVKAAVVKAGAKQQGIVPGGWFSITFTHEEEVEGVSNPVKRYEVEYRKPDPSLTDPWHDSSETAEGGITFVAPRGQERPEPVAAAPATVAGIDTTGMDAKTVAALQALAAQQGK